MFHQPQNTNSLRDTGNNTTYMVFDGELDVKLYAKDVEVRTCSDKKKHAKTKSLRGGLTVLDLTND